MASGDLHVDNIDVFCEAGVFSVEQTMRILEAGNKIGLASNFHGEELVRLNSAEVGHFFKLFFLCIESLIRPMIYLFGSFVFFLFFSSFNYVPDVHLLIRFVCTTHIFIHFIDYMHFFTPLLV